MSSTNKKRRLSASEYQLSPAVDVEDAVSPTGTSTKLKSLVSAFAYDGPSTRSATKRVKVEETTRSIRRVVSKTEKSPTKAGATPKKQKSIQMDLEVPHAVPKDWEAVYLAIKEMRKDIVAPVDTMGCASAMLEETDPRVSMRKALC